jgi:uncharacterized protein
LQSKTLEWLMAHFLRKDFGIRDGLRQLRSLSVVLIAIAIAAFLHIPEAQAVEIYDNFPATIHPGERYVIYSHGLIVEGTDARPVHPEFGVYDFPAIRTALFRDGGFNLIAHHRPKNTDVPAYVRTLETWVERLIAGGVAPGNITMVGFSRGAQITAQVASRLKASGVNTALMGICVNGDYTTSPPVTLGGRVLSLYETSDEVGSCAKLAQRSALTAFEEVAISTGRKHGAFYQPLPDWVRPLKDWIGRATAPVVPIPGTTKLTIRSTSLARHYDLYVKVPAGYAAATNARRRYPVLYLNDGAWAFQIAAGVTQLPTGAEALEGVILVGIGYAHELGSDSRIRDYTPTIDRHFGKTTGQAAAYLTFLEREVIPLIERRYRAHASRRAYAGHSLGGLFGAYVLLTQPKLFRYYILSSPSFWFDEHAVWKLERDFAQRHRDLAANVYVTIGSLERPGTRAGSKYEMVKDVLTFGSTLSQRGYPSFRIRTFVMEGATHETVFPTAFLNGMLWHFARDKGVQYGY